MHIRDLSLNIKVKETDRNRSAVGENQESVSALKALVERFIVHTVETQA